MDLDFLYKKYIKHTVGQKHEPQIQKYIKKQKGNLFVDVGANAGMYTSIALGRFSRVIAFEPNPDIVPNLERMSYYNHRLTVFRIALSNKKDFAPFYRNTNTGSADTLLSSFTYKPSPPKPRWPALPPQTFQSSKNVIQIETTTYDSMIQDKADLVKIDVEGAEFLVLEGMRRSIRAGLVRKMLVELHDLNFKKRLETVVADFNVTWLTPDHALCEYDLV